jgi:acyl carrier protein
MNLDDFREKLKIICDVAEIGPDFRMDEIDSLTRAEVIVAAEEHLKQPLTNEQILSIKTIEDLELLLGSHIEDGTGD